MGPYAGVDSNAFTRGNQPYARVDLNPMPESTLSPQSGTLDLTSADRAANAASILAKHLGGAPLGLPFLADQVDPRQCTVIQTASQPRGLPQARRLARCLSLLVPLQALLHQRQAAPPAASVSVDADRGGGGRVPVCCITHQALFQICRISYFFKRTSRIRYISCTEGSGSESYSFLQWLSNLRSNSL
jgi:hypothetical protein